MKFAIDRPYADPEVAARKLIEIANSVEAVQNGRFLIFLLYALNVVSLMHVVRDKIAEVGRGQVGGADRGHLYNNSGVGG
jgi:hypothetical protein